MQFLSLVVIWVVQLRRLQGPCTLAGMMTGTLGMVRMGATMVVRMTAVTAFVKGWMTILSKIIINSNFKQQQIGTVIDQRFRQSGGKVLFILAILELKGSLL